MMDTRVLGWAMLYLICLGILSIRVEYSDGLSIEMIGWPEKLANL
jgi:hypothetical protein